MDELTAISRARRFIDSAKIESVPVDIEHLAAQANATIKVRYDLDESESGQTFPMGENHRIIVNGNHAKVRQRFTALHEIAHIVLKLPSVHGGVVTVTDLLGYARRPLEEVLCDVFAAECLLPHHLFKEDVRGVEVGMHSIRALAEKYDASLASTGSRFAVNCTEPCAYVLIEGGQIRYVSSSRAIRELGGWIQIGVPVPLGSAAHQLLNGGSNNELHGEIDTSIWFGDRVSLFDVVSESTLLYQDSSQCLSLLWFEEGQERSMNSGAAAVDDNNGLLKELDGVLPWPSRSRRK